VYTIREANADDVGAIQAIDRLFIGTPTSAEVLRKAVAEGKVAVADSDQGLAGYVRWDHFWDTIPLCLMVRVRPEHQRRGVGRQLFRCVEETFRQRGHTFWLSSTDETNENSQRFHESYGFRQIGALAELGQDVREIFYRKDIS
jgi:ribosomal protein S18 acetylase RimI-like enzyme